MAQAGFTPVQLYHSTTAAATPSAGNLANGELAINITDGKLYYKDNGGVVRVLAGTGGTGVVAGSNTQVQFNNNGVFGASSGLTWDGTTLTANALTVSNAVTLSAGTANGVAYLNGSKVLTTGSALTFDGQSVSLTTGASQFVAKFPGGIQQMAVGSDGSSGAYVGTLDNYDVRFLRNSAEQMRLTSTGLGIGTSSPGYKLDVAGGARITNAISFGSSAFANDAILTQSNTQNAQTLILGNAYSFNTDGDGSMVKASGSLYLVSGGGTGSATLNASGNLGLGVTPSAWASQVRATEINTTAGLASFSNGTGSQQTWLLNNAYFDSSFTWRYKFTGTAAMRYAQDSGQHQWFTAPSGTAGNAISFTQAMTLDASGRLLVGTSSAASSETLRVYNSTNSRITVDQASNGLILGADASGPFFDTTGSNRLAFFLAGTERARIDSSGNLLVGKTVSQDNSQTGTVIYGGVNEGIITATLDVASGVNTYHLFNLNATNNGYRFYVNVNGGINNYSGNNVNLSDERTKKNIEVAGGYLDKICAIPVKLFNYKDEAEGEQRTLGVIAQDVEAVAPEFVNNEGWKGTTPEDGVPLKTIYATDMMFGLMRALQELKAEFDAYKATHP